MSAKVLLLAPPTKELIEAYVDAAKRRDYVTLHGSPDGYIFITDERGQFLGGVTVLPTNGKYVLYEDAVTVPGLPPRVAHSVAELVIDTIITQCNISAKIPVCPVTSPGLRSIMRRMGFYEVPTWVMRRQPAPMPAVAMEEEHKAAPEPVVLSPGDSSEVGGSETPPQAESTVSPRRQKRKAKRRVE